MIKTLHYDIDYCRNVMDVIAEKASSRAIKRARVLLDCGLPLESLALLNETTEFICIVGECMG